MENNLHIYLRVSSDLQQSDGFGLKNQKERGLKLCKSLGMKPIIHNEGSKSSHSDSIEDRPILSQLMSKVENGEVKNLYVFNNDRLSRNEIVWFHLRMKLKQNGVTLYVGDGTKYNLDNSMDDFIFGIMSEVSKYDNSIRSDRLRRGRLSSVSVGGWKGGPPPFGYQLKDKKLVPHPKEMVWVKKMYEYYSNGMSIYEIKKILMKNGVLSRRKKVIWSDFSIKKILMNTHFEGYYYYTDKLLGKTVKVDCPKTLPSSLIKKVRDRLSKLTKHNYVKTETLLRDYLVCGHCGSKFGQRINRSQYHKHYYCRGNTERLRVNGVDERICVEDNGVRVRSLNVDDTDKIIWDSVINTLSDSSLFKEIFKKDKMSETKSFGQSVNERKSIQRKIKKVEKTIEDISDTVNSIIVDGVVDGNSKEIKPLIKKYESKKLELESERDELIESLNTNKQNTVWYNWIDDFREKITTLKTDSIDVKDRKKFLDGVIDKIVVKTKDKQTHQIEIVYKSPYVDDGYEWIEKGKPKKGYKLIEGENIKVVNIDSIDKRLKKNIKNTVT